MSDINQEILFTDQGLDWDTDLRYMGQASSPYVLNILKGEDGSTGVITNMLGNTVVSYPLNLADIYLVVGSCYDELNRCVYYWVFSQPYDTTGSVDYEYDNRLLRFNEDTDTIDLIFRDTHNYMGLHYEYLMKDPFIIGTWLYFNPRVSEPKMIDVVMAFNYTNYYAYDPTLTYVYGNKVTYFGGLFQATTAVAVGQTPVTHYAKWDRISDSYQDATDLAPIFDNEFRYAFYTIKPIPVYRPICLYASDPDKNANNVRGKLFRFSHRYKYFDNSYSRYSAFSDIILPIYDEYYNGEVPGDLDQYNCIDIFISLHSASLVKEIDIIFQETGGDWKRAKVINRQDIALLNQRDCVYRFYNTDSAYELIDDTYFSEPYDSVPKIASCQEVINKNILCYGGCTEGFDNLDKNDIDVSLTPAIEAITIPNSEEIGGRRRDNIAEGDWVLSPGGAWNNYEWLTTLYFAAWYPGFGMAAGDKYILTLNGKTVTYTVQAGDIFSQDTFVSAIFSFIQINFPTIEIHFVGLSAIQLSGSITLSVSVFYQPSAISAVALTKERGFKTGAWHPFCIYYYDSAMRRWDAQTSKQLDAGVDAGEIEGTTVYVPSFTEYGNIIINGDFAVGSGGWTLGSVNWAWTSATQLMTRVANADCSTLSQNTTCVSGITYRVVYTMTRTAGTLTPSLGGTNLTPRAAGGRFAESIACGAVANAPFIFTPDATFAGTVDLVSIRIITTTANKWNINWEINHLPPFGAKWWRWGYAGNALCSEFIQYIVQNVADHATQPWTGFRITPLQTLTNPTDATWNKFPQSIISPYAWQKGDRMRVVTEVSTATEIGVLLDGTYDYEILKYDDTTVAGEHWIYVQDFNYLGANIGVESLIEIYRPIKSDSPKIFYEFGELMPIIEDSLGVDVHGCGTSGTQNQDTNIAEPAKGVFTAGDIYHILRTPSLPIDSIEGYFHESQWYSDFYDSDDWDKGRIGVETNFGERNLNIVRYSDQYLQNTLINGMPTFHGGNYKELNDIYGDILRIIESGDTLKVYQRKKPSSILIGRVEYVDAEGNANIVQTSERILGAIRYSTTNYGTEFPESISRNNRYVYGFDVYNGVFWRDSVNGIFPISGRYISAEGSNDYKMDAYFKQKAKALLVSGIEHCDVMTTWDERYKNLYVIFKDSVTDANNETIVFHEPSNRWICFTEFDQTPVLGWNQILELDYWILHGFDGGIGYTFNEDTRFAEFFLHTGGNIETLNPLLTYIVDEDGTTYIIDEYGNTYIIED